MDKEASALTEWVNTFDGPRKCESIADLADGVLLVDILNEIYPNQCDLSSFSKSPGSDLSSRQKNLTCAVKILSTFYSNVLGLELKVSECRPERITDGKKGTGREELMYLIRRILSCAVQCSGKSKFVDRIMKMSQDSQAQLMQIIDRMMKAHASMDDEEDEEDDEIVDSVGDFSDDNDDAISRSDFDDAIKENQELRRRNEELEEAIERLRAQEESSASSKEDKTRAERIRAKEYERLKQAKSAFSRREVELQDAIRDLEVQLNDAKGELEIQKKQSEATIQRLKSKHQAQADELDILTAKVARLPKLESKIVQYEKRVENVGVIREQMADMEKQNREYLDKMLDMEAEMETIPLLKKQLEEKQGQIVELNTNATKSNMQILRRDEQLKDAQEQLRIAKAKIREQETRLKDADTSIADAAQGLGISGDGDSVASIGFGSAKSREKIARLERENTKLKQELATRSEDGGTSSSSTKTESSLSESIKSLTLEKENAEMELKSTLRENLSLKRRVEDAETRLEAAKLEGVNTKQDKSEEHEKLAASVERLEKENRDLAHFRDMIPALKEKLTEKQRALEKKSLEQAKLESYVKQALAHANKTVKQSQSKYKNSLRMLKTQIEQKQKEITYFSNMLEKSKAAHRREERLLQSTVYKIGLDLNSRLLRNEALGVAKQYSTGPRSWLGRRRSQQRAS